MNITRLAPSPTGALHLGNARTFLINWLLARQNGWRVVLRIEDLDGPRIKSGKDKQAIEHIAAWVSDLDRGCGFYEHWFHAASTLEYSSTKRDFRSRFLSLDGGPRLELMISPQEPPRHEHIAISVASRPAVDRLVKEMEEAGVRIVSRPRVTGDGYYEAVIEDSEGNLVEITA